MPVNIPRAPETFRCRVCHSPATWLDGEIQVFVQDVLGGELIMGANCVECGAEYTLLLRGQVILEDR